MAVAAARQLFNGSKQPTQRKMKPQTPEGVAHARNKNFTIHIGIAHGACYGAKGASAGCVQYRHSA
jgi:hypothetical protein